MVDGSSDEATLWSFVFTGNWVAMAILVVLMVMSAASWAIIITKWLQFARVRSENHHFSDYFSRDQPLGNVFNMARKFETSPLARMFASSYREITAFRESLGQAGPGAVGDARERLLLSLSRTLERVYNQQSEILEKRLPFLAVVSSSSPYIGLFGTVLGIIDAFRSIATMGVTSLAVVAPGISEALVATAAGLMAAIPALIAYNIFRNRMREVNTEMKNFALEVTNRLERVL